MNLRILAVINGEYGQRHVENVQKYAPDSWQIDIWEAPASFPLVIDYPEDHLPGSFPPADLVLSFAEHRGAAELLPDIAKMTGAKAVIAAVDSESWLPKGLARQLRGWLEEMGVVCATPKPLCSLTGTDFGVTIRERIPFESPEIAEFALYFGQPSLKIKVDEETSTIASAQVVRDAVCGCTRYVAENIVGMDVNQAGEKAGLLHHHFPCLASMVKDPDFNKDTLMHASGHLLVDDIEEQIEPFKNTQYIKPGTFSEK